MLPNNSNCDLSAKTLRKNVIEMAYHGKTVHIACAFSIIEIVEILYSGIMKYNRGDPRDIDRDYFVLSKGHGVMALYAAFVQLGWLNREHIEKYFSDGSLLHGLSEAHIPGLEATSGSLGHGLPIAVGLAFGAKLKAEKRRVFCVVGDGEMNEGTMWEAMLFAAHQKLGNLIVIVDANGFQAMGKTSEILGLESLVEKFKSFGWNTSECDGHSNSELRLAFNKINVSDSLNSAPHVIIARTVKGKGVSFMEHDNTWHYTRLNEDTFSQSLAELASGTSEAT